MPRSGEVGSGRRAIHAVAAAALAAMALVHLSAQLVAHALAAGMTQVLLMPLLAVTLWARTAAPRGRGVRLVLMALGFSWLGDTIPRFVGGQPGFLAMLSSFLVAQVVYALAFWPLRRRSVLARPLWVLPYLVAAVVLVVLSAPGAGVLLPAVLVYAAAIAVMAVLSTGLGRLGGTGGAVFVVSDALIALNAFGVLTLPAHSVWVMGTYLLAQVLLVLAVRSAPMLVSGAGAGLSDRTSGQRPPRPPAG